MPSDLDNIYDKIGGRDGISQIAEIFYQRVLRDPDLVEFFQMTSDLTHKRGIQRTLAEGQALLAHLAGGFPGYHSSFFSQKEVLPKQKHMNERHLQRIDEHLKAALLEVGVGLEYVDKIMGLLQIKKQEISKKRQKDIESRLPL